MSTSRKLNGSGPSVTVNIDQDIIETAQRRDSSHCMIADAIKAQVPDAASVSVDLATIRWTDRKRGRRYIYLTPPLAQRALVNFDQGIQTEPFSFRLHKAAQITEAGTKASKAKQGVITKSGESAHNVPIVLGGKEPPRGALAAGSTRKRPKTQPAPSGDEQAPLAPQEPNLELGVNRRGRIRAFGLRQLRP